MYVWPFFAQLYVILYRSSINGRFLAIFTNAIFFLSYMHFHFYYYCLIYEQIVKFEIKKII